MNGSEGAGGWTLLRAAIISVGDAAFVGAFDMTLRDVRVHSLRSVTKEGTPLGTMALARIAVSHGPVAGEAYRIPEEERREAEFALETAGRLAAVEHRARHSFMSPRPCVGLLAAEPHLSALDGCAVDFPWPTFPIVSSGPAEIVSDPASTQWLRDRLDGLFLLTEALNAGSSVGAFTLYWRFFERAFKSGYRESVLLLQEFLVMSVHRFTADEVAAWADPRNSAIHANRGGEVTLESDVLHFMGRIREASYDVLLNKLNWWSKDSGRRDVWKPASGSTSTESGVFMTQGSDVHLQGLMTDEFVAYRLLLAGDAAQLLPDALWLQADANGAQLVRSGSGAPLT